MVLLHKVMLGAVLGSLFSQNNFSIDVLILDQASEEKKRLEEKQRAARKNRSKSEEDWKTRCVSSQTSWLSPQVGWGCQIW